MVVETKPYTDFAKSVCWIRNFKSDVDPNLLVWHSDEFSRHLTVMSQHKTEEDHWFIQVDNQLPSRLTRSFDRFIEAGVIHRLIKPINPCMLTLEINEYRW